MSRSAWAYVGGILAVGVILAAIGVAGLPASSGDWLTFGVLTVLATIGQLWTVQAPGHQDYHVTMVFFLAGVALLPPPLYVLLVAIPHLVEWIRERARRSARLRDWYLQPFNIATHIIAGMCGHLLIGSFGRTAVLVVPLAIVAVTLAAVAYVILNHAIVGAAIMLARGISWRESGILEVENLLTDFTLLCVGEVFAFLLRQNPLLIPVALMPLVLIYRALSIPQLKQQANTDAKTGLLNSRHFLQLFEADIGRSQRFSRPLSVVMADLDLLRNINNTYGHLAGDQVLATIGKVILETVRVYDLAGRFGGEEFAIVLPETQPQQGVAFAQRLRQRIELTEIAVQTSTTPIHVTCSFGVASYPHNATTLSALIHEADVAVYQAKLRGRNRVVHVSELPTAVRNDAPGAEGRLSTPYAAASSHRPELLPTGSSLGQAATTILPRATPAERIMPLAAERPHGQK